MSASGIDASVNFVEEDNYAVGKAPTRAFEFLKETFKTERPRIKSKGLRNGRRFGHRFHQGAIKSGGGLEWELAPQGLGIILKQTFGGVITTGSGPYVHTFTPGSIDGKSFTTQIQKPRYDGTIVPFNYVGCKVIDLELSAKVNEIVTAKMNTFAAQEFRHRTVSDAVTANLSTTLTSVTAAFTEKDKGSIVSSSGLSAGTYIKDVVSSTTVTLSQAATGTGTALVIGLAAVSPTYPTGLSPFVFTGAYITSAGVEVPVEDFSLKITTGIEAPRHKMRQFLAAISREPKENGKRMASGKFSCDWESNVLYESYLNGDEVALVLNFASGAHTLVITMNVFYSGDTPQVAGDKIIDENVPFEVTSGTSDAAAITAVLTNGDSAP